MVKRFTQDHEWLDIDGHVATVGITNYAQIQLGDVVFVELPEVGKTLAKGDEAAVVESVKAASEVYAPVSGEVIEVNTALPDAPDMVNKEPEEGGWFVKIRFEDEAEVANLMDETGYQTFLDTL
ncbi:glycine cleavage system protein GcvH [Amorphus sp. 3PC139-8]|uniref:glycine cleavage system protein GcvH n=1 Tax=Amorphus sp. 3PC139-8 TaxID=2735676 RepID=UPI00345CADE1